MKTAIECYNQKMMNSEKLNNQEPTKNPLLDKINEALKISLDLR